MVNDFVRVFRKSHEEFKKSDNREKMEIVFAILEDEILLEEVIDEIYEDKSGNMFLNLLSLMPFSLKIVEEVLKKQLLSDEDAYSQLRKLFVTYNSIIDILQKFKRNLRNKNITSVHIDEKLKEIEKELKKYNSIIEKEKEYEKKKKELLKKEKLATSLNIENLEKEIKKMQEIIREYNKLKEEFQKSKNFFKHFPKDCG